ncbi:MAG: Coenzyme F420 hydrogenase/dehydrogenase, beta subunit C-terminal domain [Bacteroides sp.]|nr:Coenzyme F420 hydrogenase/dehydrogenase, beta subunit C-terminal domain [Bacteroides sp.]MCM1447899.1 Coenzyme F420 hydrogenase/dehydrogenase, beta subunit C-terminal domain [Bacteroides sp.]
MTLDSDGYYRPVVDAGKCTDCSVCTKKCPALTDIREMYGTEPRAFYAWQTNENAIKQSSSGGIAYALGRMFVEKGAVVYGCKWDNGHVVFDKTDTLAGLDMFRGSKYVQPIASGIYRDVRQTLRLGKEVLFIGLPCHIRALRNYVSSELLTTVDILCAGIPTRLLFDGYCQWKFPGQCVTSVNFRAKDVGWRNSTVKFYSGKRLLLAEGRHINRLFLGFNSGLLYHTACYNCKLNTLPRLGDISLGDYWRSPAERDNANGNSLVLANTARGKEIVSMFDKDTVLCNEIALSEALSGNYRMNSERRDIPDSRKTVLRLLKERGFKKASDRYFCPLSSWQRFCVILRGKVTALGKKFFHCIG